jgi:hypothetical protein
MKTPLTNCHYKCNEISVQKFYQTSGSAAGNCDSRCDRNRDGNSTGKFLDQV